ncbi:MAG: glycosyltransferase family 2 protein [Planctomycetota bacterium]|nr:glycosyltransferase family 2 protein [Planctomycetota bacterium]
MSLGIVILNFRTPSLCIDAIASVVPQSRSQGDTEIIVVDGGSGDDSVSMLRAAVDEHDWSDIVRLLDLQENHGFAAGNNAAIAQLLQRNPECGLIWLLNPDTVLREHALEELVDALAEYPSWGIVGSRLEDPDGTSQNAARKFPGVLNELDSAARFGPLARCLARWQIAPPEKNQRATCDWLPGASLMIRREVFERIGLLDEGFFMYFEEVDFCQRAINAGFEVGYEPRSRVIHLVGQASGVTSSKTSIRKRRPAYWFESRGRYFLRHYGKIGFFAANVAWLTGHLIYGATTRLRGRTNQDPPYFIRDFLKHLCHRKSWQMTGDAIYPKLNSAANSRPLA